jgi:hypothetical protein
MTLQPNGSDMLIMNTRARMLSVMSDYFKKMVKWFYCKFVIYGVMDSDGTGKQREGGREREREVRLSILMDGARQTTDGLLSRCVQNIKQCVGCRQTGWFVLKLPSMTR